MKRIAAFKIVIILLVNLVFCWTASAHSAKSFQFNNGQWFDGKSFKARTMYSVNGILRNSSPKQVDEIIDLKNNFIVSPFGEAHNHNLGGVRGLETQIKQYLRDGVFYSQNLHYVRELTLPVLDKVNTPSSVDVAYAHAGLGASGGHVVELYENLFKRGAFPNWKAEDLDTKAFFIIDSPQDLEKKWDAVLEGKPSLIKVYLEYSEEYEKRKTDAKFYGHRGIDPKNLPLIVKKAHREGLKVTAHIETSADFRNALLGGVDEIAHLPGYRIDENENITQFQLAEADARLAAKKRVAVMTTTVLSRDIYSKNSDRLKIIQENQIRNLKLLKKYGVRIIIGSDSLRDDSLAEALNLLNFQIFDNLALLKMWSEETPKSIFPKRKIGSLKQGFESSFLVLSCNPLENFECVKKINLHVKQGQFIQMDEGTK